MFMSLSSKKKKWTSMLLLASMSAGIVSSVGVPRAQAAAGIADHVVISQVYGAGGNSGATYSNDFIELYNPTNSDVSLNNWSVQYGSAAGSSALTSKTNLSGTIHAHGYYLIQGSRGTTASAELPTPDASGSISMAAGSGKVALVSSTVSIQGTPAGDIGQLNDPTIVDFVGYGDANQFETAKTPVISATTAAVRKASSTDTTGTTGSGAGYDTNDNSADFIVAAPNPRNAASPLEAPPSDGGSELPASSKASGKDIQLLSGTLTGYAGAVASSSTVRIYTADTHTLITSTASQADGTFEAVVGTAASVIVTVQETGKTESVDLTINEAAKAPAVTVNGYVVDGSNVGTVAGTAGAAGAIISVYSDEAMTDKLSTTGGAQSVTAGGDKSFSFALNNAPAAVYVTQQINTANGRGLESDAVKAESLDTSGVTPISTLRLVDATGSPVYKNQTFTIEGVATAANNILGATTYYIQDGTGGINVYGGTTSGLTIAQGDRLRLTGTLIFYNGLSEFQPSAVERLGDGADLPAPVETTAASLTNYSTAEPLEGKLVTLTATVTAQTASGANYNMTVQDPADTSKTITVRVMSTTGIDVSSSMQVGKTYVITGLVGQYDSGSPYTTGYQLFPRSTADVVPTLSITHTPIQQTYVNVDVNIQASVDGATSVKLYYRKAGTTEYTAVPMTLASGSTYTATIPKEAIGSSNFEYYIEAASAVATKTSGSAASPYAVTLISDDEGPEYTGAVPEQDYRVETYRPSIAIELDDLSGIDMNTISLALDETDVTPSITKTPASAANQHVKVSYTPAADLVLGTHTLKVSSKDAVGNVSSFEWSFIVSEPFTGGNHYRGTTHNHTNISHDGTGAPEDALKAAQKYGYDWFAFSDHSHDIDAPASGTFTDTVKNEGGMEERTGGADWQLTKTLSKEYTKNNEFVVFPAFEMTSTSWGHSNVFGTENFIDRKENGGIYNTDVNQYYAWVLTHDEAVAQFNHPNDPKGSFNNMKPDVEAEKLFTMFEVGNGSGHYSYANAEQTYFGALDLGWKVAPTYGEDNHDGTWGQTMKRTIIVSKDLSPESLLDSMRKRRVYMVEDPNMTLDFMANGTYMGGVAEGSKLNFSVKGNDTVTESRSMTEYNYLPANYASNDNIAKVELISNGGKVIDSYVPTESSRSFAWEPSVDVSGGQQWYMVRVTQMDGERAYSAPIWSQDTAVDVKISAAEVEGAALIQGTEASLKADISNSGTSVLASLSVKFYYDNVDEAHLIGTSTIDSLASNTIASVTVKWPDPVVGNHKLIAVVSSPEGDNPEDNTYTIDVTVKAPLGIKIMVDAGHKNENTSGDPNSTYKNKMGLFKQMLAQEGYTVAENTSALTPEVLSGVKVLVVTNPGVDFTADENAAVKAFVDGGGSLFMLGKSNFSLDPTLNNDLLESIGSTIQISNDGIFDDSATGNYWSTPATTKHAVKMFPNIVDNGIMDGVNWLEYYSGSSLFKLGGGPLTNSDSVSILAGGNETTYQGNVKSPTYTYDIVSDATGGSAIPGIASEILPNNSRIVVTGMNVVNDLEWDNTYGDYGNNDFGLNAINWLAGRGAAVSDIGSARALQDGTDVVVQGVVTTGAGVFFDAFYLQDATGGIMAFKEVPDGSLKVGDTVRVHGKIKTFENNKELEFDSFAKDVVVVKSGLALTPKSIATGDADLPANQGLLVKVKGFVTKKYDENSYVINDGSGEILVFTDGYIANQSGPVPQAEIGEQLEAVGLLGGFSDGTRIRVRDTKELKVSANDGLRGLTDLTIKDQDNHTIALTPSFDMQRTVYDATVSTSVTQLSFAATPLLEGATVTYEGVNSSSGINATLATPDSKTYIVQLSVEKGDWRASYMLQIKRTNPKDSSIKKLQVFDNTNEVDKSPVVTQGVKNYSVEVESNVKQLLLSVTPTDMYANVTITGGVQDPKEPVKAMFNIPDKTTVFTLTVTSPDGTTTETYILTVTKKDAAVVTPPTSGSGGGTTTPASPLEEALGNATSSAITVKVSGTSFTISAAELAKFLAQNKVETIVIESQSGSYSFNPGQYDWSKLAGLLGLSLNDLQLKLEASNDQTAADSADKAGLDVLGSANFKLKAVKKDGQEIVLNDLGHYIKHTIKLGSQPAAGHVAVVRVDTDAKGNPVYTPVPFTVNGSEVSVMSRTDGTFLIVRTDKSFDDTATHWAKKEIDALANLLIVDGVGDGTFDPNRSITRAEFTALVVRLFGLATPAAAGNGKFGDVQADDWFASVVAAATGAGLINGYENGEFRPDQTISREEMAVILSRGLAFAGHKGEASGAGAFTDQSEIPAWAAEAISQLAGFGIVNGKPGNEFDPAGEATRAESVAMLYRLLPILTFAK
ncbi:CARDB protein [Paenibacillus sp. BK033]|uniref:S-layer homology domain-containing protein n=1 Tax=Paenibacillus sp. BK033 TaxID=2512133 RepID=UPI00105267E4|nr:S-layer homology domain-containing protein [Paenibacillus sp. BK033]TCN00981.1 CARDB protein [Paenibacillus sp. BK033]